MPHAPWHSSGLSQGLFEGQARSLSVESVSDRFPVRELQCPAAELPVYFQSPATSPEALLLLLFGRKAS